MSNNNNIIKINRARNLSNIGRYPKSFNEMIKILPSETIKSLTSKHLAVLVDNIWQGCQTSKLIQEMEICDQGYIWDSKQNKMRDLVD